MYTALATSLAAVSIWHVQGYHQKGMVVQVKLNNCHMSCSLTDFDLLLQLASLFWTGREGIGFFFICCVGLSLGVWGFFLFNLGLVIFNYTTIELREKRGFPFDVDHKYVNVFDIGILENLRSVLGPNPMLWILPVQSVPSNSGIIFPTNPHGKRHRMSSKIK
jgi:hypothetical protein